MNVKIKIPAKEFDRPAPPISTTLDDEREAISCVCAYSSSKRQDTSWSEIIQKSYSNPTSIHRHRLNGDQFSHSEYEDIFEYVLGMLEDTDSLEFVDSLYDWWSRRGRLSERQHQALMRFYNNLKRRYG